MGLVQYFVPVAVLAFLGLQVTSRSKERHLWQQTRASTSGESSLRCRKLTWEDVLPDFVL